MRAGGTGVIELRRRIAASPETVFSYFVDPERYRLWQGVDAELDPRPGGLFRVTTTGHSRHVARGSYVEVDPPRRLVFTWGWEANPELREGQHEVRPGASTVEVSLAADGDGTVLVLRHSGLPNDGSCRFHNFGWEMSLGRLLVVAEGGDPGPYPFANL
jgi:uncharacterized protein YndB with AHSA1/START domain